MAQLMMYSMLFHLIVYMVITKIRTSVIKQKVRQKTPQKISCHQIFRPNAGHSEQFRQTFVQYNCSLLSNNLNLQLCLQLLSS